MQILVAPLEKGTKLKCIKSHPDGVFTVGQIYKVAAHRMSKGYIGVRIRDDKRERKDFNFIADSKNFIWEYFERA